VDDEDVTALARRAASTPVARRGEQGGRWQEAGYRLVPLVSLIFLAGFRREKNAEVSA